LSLGGNKHGHNNSAPCVHLHIGVAELKEEEALEGLEEGLIEVEVGHLGVVVQQRADYIVYSLCNNKKIKIKNKL